MTEEHQAQCLYCKKNQHDVPLIIMTYQDRALWICPQHLPIIIHKPEQLVDILPGSDEWSTGKENNHH